MRFNDLLATLKTLPARSIVLLHPCCHNPTGADLTNDQWDAVIEILKARELIPFLDIAYQGFGAGMEEGCLRYSRHCQRWITRSGEQFVLENFLPLRRARRRTFCYV